MQGRVTIHVDTLGLIKCKNLEGSTKEITYFTTAIKRKLDLPQVDCIQAVWHFPSS